MSILQNIDIALFHFLNSTISNPFFDKFFPFITNLDNWLLLYIFLILLLFFKGGKKGKVAVVSVIILIAVSDQLSSVILKDFFARVRPCSALDDVNLLVRCSKSFSMPSSHAVNNFAIATFFSILYKNYKIILFTIASFIAISRPIVGVHYFSDVLIGAIIGYILGYVFAKTIIKLRFING